MAQGTMKNIVGDQGFGFITPDDGTPDLFVQARELMGAAWDDLQVGDRVTYTPEAQPDGRRRATTVEAVSHVTSARATREPGDTYDWDQQTA